MEIYTWRDILIKSQKLKIPRSFINWGLAVYGADSAIAKTQARGRKLGKWEQEFKNKLPKEHIQRPHLMRGRDIPISTESFTEYEYFPIMRNIVAKCSWIPLGDLSRIAQFAPCVELNSEHASAISVRIDKILCRFFTTGVIVLTTCETVEQAKFEMQQCRMFFERIPIPILVYDEDNPRALPTLTMGTLEHFSMMSGFKLVNFVASAVASEHNLDLMKITKKYQEIGLVNWDPENFPGATLIITPKECPVQRNVSVGLFDTGRNMLMGSSREDLKEAQKFIRNWVKHYIDENLPRNSNNRFKYRIMKLLQNNDHVIVPNRREEDDTQQNILDILDILPTSYQSSRSLEHVPVVPTTSASLQMASLPAVNIQVSEPEANNIQEEHFEEANIQKYLNDLLNAEMNLLS